MDGVDGMRARKSAEAGWGGAGRGGAGWRQGWRGRGVARVAGRQNTVTPRRGRGSQKKGRGRALNPKKHHDVGLRGIGLEPITVTGDNWIPSPLWQKRRPQIYVEHARIY